MPLTSPDAPRVPVFRVARVLTAALLLSCGGDGGSGPSGPRPTTIVVVPGAVELDQADSLRLEVSVLDENDELITGISVSFATSDPARVSVSSTGMVRSVGAPGEVVVTVATGTGPRRITRDVPVAVHPVPAVLEVTPNPIGLAQGGSVQVTATVKDPFGQPIPGVPVSYMSLAPGLFSVSVDGLVQAGTGSGGGTLRVKTVTLELFVPVAVAVVPTSVFLGPPAISLIGGESATLTTAVLDAGGVPIAGLAPTLTSSDPEVLTVTTPSQVHAPGPAGIGTITATYGALSASIPFTVAAVGVTAGRGYITGAAYGAAISGSGTLYAAIIGGGIARGDLPAFTLGYVHAPGDSYAVAFAPSGDAAYVTGLAGADVVTRLDPETDAVVTSSPQLPATVFDLIVSADGSRVYAGTDGGYVVALDPATLEILESRKVVDNYINHLAVHPSQALVYASSPGHYTVAELDGASLATTRSFTLPGLWQGLAVTPDGGTLIVANEGGSAQTWNLLSGTSGPTLSGAIGAFGARMSPNGSTVWMSVSNGGRILRIALPSGEVQEVYQVNGTPRRIGIRPDGSTVAVANQLGWVDFITP